MGVSIYGFRNVCVCVCLDFVMCEFFDNCVGILVICVLVFIACFCFVYVYLFLFVTSVRATATEQKLK